MSFIKTRNAAKATTSSAAASASATEPEIDADDESSSSDDDTPAATGVIDPKQPNPDGTWNVEKILDKRIHRGEIEYLVKWLGWDDPEDNTWQKIADLRGAEWQIKKYEVRYAEHRRRLGLGPEKCRPAKSKKQIAADIARLLADKEKPIVKVLQMWPGDRMAGTINEYAVLWNDGLVYKVDENWVASLPAEGDNRKIIRQFVLEHMDEIIALKDKVAKRNLAIARRLDREMKGEEVDEEEEEDEEEEDEEEEEADEENEEDEDED